MKNSGDGTTLAYSGGEARQRYGAEMIIQRNIACRNVSARRNFEETLTPSIRPPKGVKQATLRKLTDQALELLDTCAIAELLPPELARGMSLPGATYCIAPPRRRSSSPIYRTANTRRSSGLFLKLLARLSSMLALRAGAQRYHISR